MHTCTSTHKMKNSDRNNKCQLLVTAKTRFAKTIICIQCMLLMCVFPMIDGIQLTTLRFAYACKDSKSKSNQNTDITLSLAIKSLYHSFYRFVPDVHRYEVVPPFFKYIHFRRLIIELYFNSIQEFVLL